MVNSGNEKDGGESDNNPAKRKRQDQQQLAPAELSNFAAGPTEQSPLVSKLVDQNRDLLKKYSKEVDENKDLLKKYNKEQKKRIHAENDLKKKTTDLLRIRSMLDAAGVIKHFDEISQYELKDHHGWSHRDAINPQKERERYKEYYEYDVRDFRKVFDKLLRKHMQQQSFSRQRLPDIIKKIEDNRNYSAHSTFELEIGKECKFTQEQRIFLKAICECASVSHTIDLTV